MSKNKRLEYGMLMVFFGVFAGLSIQNDLCQYGLPGWQLVLTACFAALLLAGWRRFRYRLLLWLAVAAAAAGICVMGFWGKGGEAAARGMEAFFRWYLMGAASPGAWCYQSALFLTMLLLTPVCFLGAGNRRVQWGLAGVLAAFAAAALLLDVRSSNETSVGIYLYLFVTAMGFSGQGKDKTGDENSRRIVLSLIPVILLAGLLLFTASKPEKVYQWNFARSAAEFVEKGWKELWNRFRFYRRGESDVFSLSFTGYSENGDLGTGVTEDHRRELTITFRSQPKTNLYLMGSVWDTFDDGGGQALAEEPPVQPDILSWTVDGMEQGTEEKGELERELISQIHAEITYQDIYTKTIFLPEHTRTLSIPEKGRKNNGNRVYRGRPGGTGFDYMVSYHQWNLGSQAWNEFAETAAEEWTSLSRQDSREREQQERYTEYVYRTYLDVPEVSPAVERYLEERLEGTQGYEKLLALEALLQQYRYTKSPAPIGEGKGFLEEFLLETREGYCTYFATAFTLLARYYGFPARYVQGYCVPTYGVSAGESVEVYSEYAHAWPQVWIDGIGWVSFDPTPSQGEVRYTPWTTKKPVQAPAAWEEEQESAAEMQQPGESEELPEDRQAPRWLFAAGAAIAVMLAVGLLTLVWLEYRYRRKRKADTLEGHFTGSFMACLELLALLGLDRETGETLADLCSRISRKDPLGTLLPPEIFTAYEALYYGGVPVAADQCEKVDAAKKALFDYYKKTHSKLRTAAAWLRLRYLG